MKTRINPYTGEVETLVYKVVRLSSLLYARPGYWSLWHSLGEPGLAYNLHDITRAPHYLLPLFVLSTRETARRIKHEYKWAGAIIYKCWAGGVSDRYTNCPGINDYPSVCYAESLLDSVTRPDWKDEYAMDPKFWMRHGCTGVDLIERNHYLYAQWVFPFEIVR